MMVIFNDISEVIALKIYLKLLRICTLLVVLIMGSPLMDAKGSTITMVAPSMINVEAGWDELYGQDIMIKIIKSELRLKKE